MTHNIVALEERTQIPLKHSWKFEPCNEKDVVDYNQMVCTVRKMELKMYQRYSTFLDNE
jgi:hypothetical protein